MRCAIVLTKHEADAKRARSALERGTSWKAVARRYSIDAASKRNGGKLPAAGEGHAGTPLDKAVFKAAKHRLVGPIRTHYGYWVFTVTEVEPARQQPLAEVKDAIKDTLVSEAQQAALDAFVQDFTARWRAKTECADGIQDDRLPKRPAARPVKGPRPARR